MIKLWLERFFLMMGSFLLTAFLLFCIFEIFPDLPNHLPIQRIHYYALKERYLTDSERVFKRKPLYKYQGFFVGDHYGLFSDPEAPRIPYSASFDRHGFRNPINMPSPEVALIGDSFIEFGLNESDLVASRLSELTKRVVGTYGMEWYGPYQYLAVFREFILPMRPRMAILCFFEGNDLRDTVQFLNWKNGGSYYHFNLTDKNLLQRFGITLKDVCALIAKLFLRSFDPRTVQLSLGKQVIQTVFSYPLDLRIESQILESPEAQAVDKLFKEFADSSLSNNIKPVILFVPSKDHVYTPFTTNQSNPAWLKTKDSWLAARHFQENAIKTLALKNSADWISLTPAFEHAASEGRFLFYPTDTHWNSEGRQVAAEVIRQSSSWRQIFA